jgi:hypothetical protein
MYENLKLLLDLAEKRLAELEKEYIRTLTARTVSLEAVQLTHEVCEKLKSALDRVCSRYFLLHVADSLPAIDRDRARIYFPICNDQNSFDSTLGRWRWKSISEDHRDLYNYLLSLQPFTVSSSLWLSILSELAAESKHIDLVPQKRISEKRTTVTSKQGGTVSWGSGVTFGDGVSILGVAIDAQTQRVIPNNQLKEVIEEWVSFQIQGYGIDALGFCKSACRQVRCIVGDMSSKFRL